LATSNRKGIIESLLFSADQPLSAERLVDLLELERRDVVAVIAELQEEYIARNGGIELQEVAGGFQFRTRPEFAPHIRRMLQSKPFRFSRAALETLAIIAYRQPVTRAEVEYLRGVDCGGVVKTLLDKRLIKILGKKDVPGRPMIYGTTREFLELFGLKDLAGLPTLKEFSELNLEIEEPPEPVE